MGVGLTLIILGVLIAGIWIIIEVKRLKHKLFAILLIGLIIFAYMSFYFTLAGKGIDYSTFSGIQEATGIYFSWLASIFSNMASITSNAINMDWSVNNTFSK